MSKLTLVELIAVAASMTKRFDPPDPGLVLEGPKDAVLCFWRETDNDYNVIICVRYYPGSNSGPLSDGYIFESITEDKCERWSLLPPDEAGIYWEGKPECIDYCSTEWNLHPWDVQHLLGEKEAINSYVEKLGLQEEK